MKTAIFAAILAASASVPAMAQEAEPFTGPRIGVTGGYDKFQGQDGFSYGVTAGYDIAAASQIRAGVDVALSDSTTSGTVPGFDGAADTKIDASRDLAASLRLGYVLTPQVMPFAKVGYANSRVETAFGNATFEGVRYGGGLEYAPTPKTFVSAEYQRTEYEANLGGRDAGVVTIGYRF